MSEHHAACISVRTLTFAKEINGFDASVDRHSIPNEVKQRYSSREIAAGLQTEQKSCILQYFLIAQCSLGRSVYPQEVHKTVCYEEVLQNTRLLLRLQTCRGPS